MKNKMISLGVCFVILMALLSGCGSTENTAQEDTGMEPHANTKVFPEFQTTDLSGSIVDSSVFADKQLTMLNIWGTFCGPCIEEMPDLAAMSENMPEGTAIVGLIIDALDEKRTELAKKIVAETGVKYTNLITDEVLDSYIQEYVIGVPMTIFIDSSGNIVGDALIGAKSAEVYMKELTERLNANVPDASKSTDVPVITPDSTDTPSQETKAAETLDGTVHTDFTLNCNFYNAGSQTFTARPASFSLDMPSDWELQQQTGSGTPAFAAYEKDAVMLATISLRERAAGINPMFQAVFSDLDGSSSAKDLKIAGYPAKLFYIDGGIHLLFVAPDELTDMYIEFAFYAEAGTEDEIALIASTLSVQ